ncbi:HBL147Cp [Eremothecium sinecaudum]|uniref:Chorismate mutase n=1 Tax=Eremothecium sinecaudum TaxID=45286 RepID=A0A109UWD5_9SACH|nr:HBL147Cp [Eremothecium sinecaudum]AMD18755.1 HBL147Cp [Eremothecium sinecaudum]
MDFFDVDSVLNLDNIRRELVRMEDSIIFKFIERTYFPTCPVVYQPDERIPIPNFDGSLIDWAHLQMEKAQSQIRRFESPGETPFFPNDILKPVLPSLNYPAVLTPKGKEVNYNGKIKQTYIKEIIPLISRKDGNSWENLGSVTACDIDILQALSRRIHFGKFVAEAKFRKDEEMYTKMIRSRDIDGIMKSITNSKVEEEILERLKLKANVYGVDPADKDGERRITPEYLVKIYKEYVIPLTKEVEVDYLLSRLD